MSNYELNFGNQLQDINSLMPVVRQRGLDHWHSRKHVGLGLRPTNVLWIRMMALSCLK